MVADVRSEYDTEFAAITSVRQKVPGCLRTLTGAAQFCAIRST
jgi:hypothetical protein